MRDKSQGSDTSSVVEFTSVSKSYRLGGIRVQALRDLSMTVPRNRFSAIIGSSGSGKSTLLNLIGCIDRPDAGDIRVCDREIKTLSDDGLSDFRARNIGFIFQNFSLLPMLNVYEAVEQPLGIIGVPKPERHKRTLEMLKAVGLLDQQRQRPNQLSGGQQQRVAIARALVKEPELVLADEPTANLDSATGKSILELMRRMQRELTTAFIVCTHDRQVVELAQEVFLIKDGKLDGRETRPSGGLE